MPVTIDPREDWQRPSESAADGATVTPPLDAILDRQLAVATNHVNAYAPSAPDVVLNQAVITIAQHLFEGWPMEAAFSGADAILEHWHESIIVSL